MEIDMDTRHWEHGPCPKHDCRKDSCKCGLRLISFPAALGDDSKGSPVAPKNGDYCNALVKYESNGHIYIYTSDGIPVLVENGESCSCEEEVINLSVVIDNDSWGTPHLTYSLGSGDAIGVVQLSAAQGNQGLFQNDDSGEFVTEGELYEMIASGTRVKLNHVPVGQSLTSPHTDSLGDTEYVNGIELTNEFITDIDGAPMGVYSATVSFLQWSSRSGMYPPLGVFLMKIDQEDPSDDTYEFYIQGRFDNTNYN